jgi:flavin-dependent dehydrogenase
MNINNIAIVGGGTSGLVCALILRKTYPKLKIDLIESEKIGIVGVGEGSTEHWNNFMFHCEINTSKLIKETDATFKYGINFANWNGDGKNYLHSISNGFTVESQTNHKFLLAYLIANGYDEKSIVHPYVEKSLHTKPYWTINQFHFNTLKLNKFLHNLCEERNIGVIKCEIENVNLNEEGFIDSLQSTDNRIFKYDFYVDSTGFNKLLLHKKLNAKWISYKEYLPLNSAIAFRTERTEDIPSWTLSQSMNSGWLWRIPTQESYGNGYVFNENFISPDEAKKEVEELYGYEIEVGKHIKFDAGHLDKFWIKNCAAIGLSGSFVEPLEASSIGSSIQQSMILSRLISTYSKDVNYAERTYNKLSTKLTENIIDFVALHYCVKRNDTKFWKYIQNLPKTDSLKEKLQLFSTCFPNSAHFENRELMFKETNWIYVMHGLGIISKDVAKKTFEIQPDHIKESIKYNLKNILEISNENPYVSHREALQWLVDNVEAL